MAKRDRSNLTIRMEPSLKEVLQIQAIRERRDLSDLIEDGARLYLSAKQINLTASDLIEDGNQQDLSKSFSQVV